MHCSQCVLRIQLRVSCLLGGLAPRAVAAEREFRGTWVATVYNLDWPSKPGLPAATQKAQLRALLDRAAELKLNAILLQVRPASDALYASTKEPWSQFLSGKAGVSPGYDPLEFAIAEAHARGLELHAWVNPFRAAISAKRDAARESCREEASGMGAAFRETTLDRSRRTGGARLRDRVSSPTSRGVTTSMAFISTIIFIPIRSSRATRRFRTTPPGSVTAARAD